MDAISIIISYTFATLVALSILYFFYGISKIKHSYDYAKIDEGADNAFTSLTLIFWVLIAWIVIHSLIVVFI